jgi:hypothetical protein
LVSKVNVAKLIVIRRTMSKTTRKKCKFKNELVYSHGLLPVDESKTSISRFCLSFGRENVQSEAQQDVPGAQPAATAQSGGPPKQKELQLALTRSPRLKAELEGMAAKPTASFQSCWLPVMPRYPNLREVAAGLATVFPGSSSVESDFSILKQDKSPQRSRLADLTVEGHFHARQWPELERLEKLCVTEQADANE